MKKFLILFLFFLAGCPVQDMMLLDNSTWIHEEAIREVASRAELPPGTYLITFSSSAYYAAGIPVKKILLYTSGNPYVITDGDTITLEIEDEVLAFFVDIKPEDNSGYGTVRFEREGETYILTVMPEYNVLDVGDYTEYFSAVRISPGDYVLSFSSDLESGGREIKRVLLYNTTDNDPYGWFWVLEEGEEKEITVTGEGLDAEYLYGTVIVTEEPSGRGEVRIERLP